MITPSDKDILKRATPYIRSLVALAIYCSSPAGTAVRTIDVAYQEADKFLKKLSRDLE